MGYGQEQGTIRQPGGVVDLFSVAGSQVNHTSRSPLRAPTPQGKVW